MRLIDADALFKEEREEYRNNACYISTDYEHIFAEINNSPTVCDIEQIRDEIEQLTSRYSISKERGGMGQVEWSDRLIKESDVLQIIDKYKAQTE